MAKIGRNFASSLLKSTPLPVLSWWCWLIWATKMVLHRQQLVCQDYLTEWEMVTSIWRSINYSVVVNQGQEPLYWSTTCKQRMLWMWSTMQQSKILKWRCVASNFQSYVCWVVFCLCTPCLCQDFGKRSSTCLTTWKLVTSRLQICAKDQVRA